MKSMIVAIMQLFLLAWPLAPVAAQSESPEGLVLAMREPSTTAAHDTKAHPFASIAGNWTGGGTMEMTGDITEKLRCRANHSFRETGGSLALNIRCASDNYKFELTSDVVERRGQISGKWSEVTYKANGSITGRVTGNRIVALARSDSLTTEVSLTTTGNRQTIVITPEKTYVIKVQIALARR